MSRNYSSHDKQIIRYRINAFFKRHGMQRGPCQICGNSKTEIHHPSYEKETLINYLCQSCHNKVTYRDFPCPEPINLSAICGVDYGVKKDTAYWNRKINEYSKEKLDKHASTDV